VKVVAMILAGGKSSRMGRDKATIEIDGVPMLRRIYDIVASCNDGGIRSIESIYIVTPWVERYRSILPMPGTRGCANDCNFITEEDPHRGPLVGFAQGLSQIEADWVLLLACDLPNLTTSFIQNSMLGTRGCASGLLRDIPIQSMAYLPKSDRGWEPLCGFYRGNCLDSLQEYINGGGQSFQGWLKTEIVTELTGGNPQILLNCNTPADLAEIIEAHIPIPKDRR
jgi:molybdenum cofactor guanylyltransferase